MTAAPCTALDLPRLIGYWLDELAAPEQAQVEEHVFACDSCARRLAFVADVAHGARALARAGDVALSVTRPFLERLAEHDVRLREYRLSPGGSVNCTITPEDDVLVSCLQAPLEGVERVDALYVRENGELERYEDLLFDPAAGEVLLVPPAPMLRAIAAPATQYVRLIAVDGRGGERTLGEYRFHHTPYTPP